MTCRTRLGRARTRRVRGVLIDLTPLRRSRDLRALLAGEVVSVLGSQMTAVAVPYQVFELTHSSLEVSLISLAMLPSMLAGALLGGSVADAVDRRHLLMVLSVAGGALSAGLALNASPAPALWPLFVCSSLAAGIGTFADASLGAVVPNLVARAEVPAAHALFQAVFNIGLVAGPALAGALLAATGAQPVFWVDTVTFAAVALAVWTISPQTPDAAAGRGARPGWRSVVEGVRFLRGRQVVQGALVIDANATVFGMPRALFPALAAGKFGGSATALGLLYAAPGAGALAGVLTSGWIGRIRRQGRSVIVAVIGWGLAISAFGVASWLPAALILLAAAGYADVVSAVLRSTLVQLAVPDALRGRLAGLQTAVVTGAPRLGDLEAGVVATALGDTISIVTGGLACVAGAVAIARLLPDFRRQRADMTNAADVAAPSFDVVEERERWPVDQGARAP
jgi:MFS family permease